MGKDLDYYMGLSYTIEVTRDDESEWTWFAKVPDLPGCMTEAPTWEELLPMVEDAKRAWIGTCLEDGYPVPEPQASRRKSKES